MTHEPGCTFDSTDPEGRVIEIARLMAERRRREPKDDWISRVAGADDDTAAEATSAIVAMRAGLTGDRMLPPTWKLL
jgi:hypothetical protein